MVQAAHTDTPAPAASDVREQWHTRTPEETLRALGADGTRGLTRAEAARRLARYGPNKLAEERHITFWAVFRDEVTEPMILLLLVVGVAYAVSGELPDAIAIFLIISGIVFVEVFNEYRAKAAIASLQRMAAPAAPVIRDGVRQELPARDLVPGDLVDLSPGRRVPADLRLLSAVGLRVDESSLTGESVPVSKRVDAVAADAGLGDRADIAYAGTLVTSGKGQGLVVATGMSTEFGRIVGLVKSVREPRTPLQLAMRQLAGWLVWLAIGFSALVPALGFLFGQPLREMILTGLTLAFATIPEELPILITVVLGLGALRLSRRNAVVKRLRAAETLGSVTVIASDKTGTITENHMALAELWLPGQGASVTPAGATRTPAGRLLLEIGVLANDASTDRSNGKAAWVGDPTDGAFMEAAEAAGLDPIRLRADGLLQEFTFDDHRRLMSVVYERNGEVLVASKGAPEAVLSRCSRLLLNGAERELDDAERARVLALADELAGRGLRVLSLAYKTVSPTANGWSGQAAEQVETALVFAGLAGLMDPPRAEVPAALNELRSAGIRVLMLTGDHPATARAVSAQVGIPAGRVVTGRDLEATSDEQLRSLVSDVSVYARITPEHKLRIVRALGAGGEVVAVTGDGVNDAPALKEAAIGVAMGQTGADVAKEAADMVLRDDNFATIAVAVREGRKLYENLRKAVRYYLAVKIALIATTLFAVLAQVPLPFSPIQIIVTEFFMDIGASVSFTAEPAEGDVMARPPRDPRRPFMDRAMQYGIFAGGASLCVAVLFNYLWTTAQGAASEHTRTVAFATWMIGHVLLAFHMRSERQPLLRLGLFTNLGMVVWGLGALLVVLLATFVPVVSDALKTTGIAPTDWALIVVVPLLTTSWWEVWKLARWRRRPA